MTVYLITYDKLSALLARVKEAMNAEYPQKLREARRAEFVRRIEAHNGLQSRCEEIEEALRNPFMDKATAFELLNELAEIQTTLNKE